MAISSLQCDVKSVAALIKARANTPTFCSDFIVENAFRNLAKDFSQCEDTYPKAATHVLFNRYVERCLAGQKSARS